MPNLNNEITPERSSKKTNNQSRAAFIRRIAEGFNITESALLSDIPYNNATKIYAKFKATGIIEKQTPGSPSNKKVTPDLLHFIENTVEDLPTIILSEIKTKILIEKAITISIESIRKAILSLGITRKKVTQTGVHINSDRNKLLRKEYARTFLEEHHDDSFNVFIDESGFNIHMRRTQGRSARGQIVQVLVPAVRGVNVSLLSAINGNSVLHHKCVSGAVNAVIFKEFLGELRVKCENLAQINRFTFIMDNARIHHALTVQDFSRENGLNLLFLSPYSYMLNPIEFSFSKVKSVIRRELSNGYTGSFTDIISAGVMELTIDDMAGYFRHIRNNCIKAITLENFI